jgi:hypothetical protein
MKRVFMAAIFLACSGCNEGPDPLLGVYRYGAEINTFQPCGGDDVFWVVGADSIQQMLRAAHDSLVAVPGDGILVRVFTRHSGTPREGFARRYDANLRITQVLEIAASGSDDCLGADWALPGRRATYFN